MNIDQSNVVVKEEEDQNNPIDINLLKEEQEYQVDDDNKMHIDSDKGEQEYQVDDDTKMHIDSDKEDDDDEIIKEIPINLTSAPYPVNVLQYPNKPKRSLDKNRALPHPYISQVNYKEKSKLWELEIPLNEQLFYDKEGAEEKWPSEDIKKQFLRGVCVDETDQFVGVYANDQIYLVPVQGYAQLRPCFKHIDESTKNISEGNNVTGRSITSGSITTTSDNNSKNSNNANRATMVTMSVKSTSEANKNRLGGALAAHKIEEEEEIKILDWVDQTFGDFKNSIINQEAHRNLDLKLKEGSDLAKIFE
ncbi:uncharacterized protein SCODWIG_01513 [Saccharomycodes ludwigii]|uniref:DNA-directed RNA polymerase III subunit RPC5 n=1 Tax=Saccharomycodes ludwigii TaxID=36035 RepID=A0A376B553_9ASCO|nr:hypothetical protein SCDLUD_003660 [Saccharomycodes ludwigii]KAH3900663.1 hypothetical protein SCDLUD_003660 [Saccharomycodes ludwigii]SSD59752.1 uncharacterized protein SCODWIG_01513 [Saccharomycodes ludwigii]